MDIRPRPDGALIFVSVRPRSRLGLAEREGVLSLGVAAAPAQGRANEEARRALAAALGVPPSSVVLGSGARSRAKRFIVGGLTAGQARERLAAACEG